MKLRYILAVLLITAFAGSAAISKPAPARTDVLHVYLTDNGKLIYLCTTDKPVQPQVLNCDGGTVLLTAQLYEKVVLSTFLIGER